MPQIVVLFRGINVGGRNRLPMRDLVPILEACQLQRVRTYIQSGNVVAFKRGKPAKTLARKIADAIFQEKGFRPTVLVLSQSQFSEAQIRNPFDEMLASPKSLHLFFLAQAADSPNWEAIERAGRKTERWKLVGDVFYLFAPDGIGKSKLAAGVERWLGVPTTARNWNTIQEIAAMLEQN